MDRRIQLYHYSLSHESQAVREVLCEKSLAWEGREIRLSAPYEDCSAWYLRQVPNGDVPALVHGDRVLTGVEAICRYLDEEFPDPALIPRERGGRRLVEEWSRLQLAIPKLDLTYACLGRVLRHMVLHEFASRQRKLVRVRRRYPELAGVSGCKLEQMADWEASIRDRPHLDHLLGDLEGTLDRLDRHLSGRPWIAGDRYSLADVLWGVLLARLRLLGLGRLWEGGRRPELDRYYQRIRARPCFRTAAVAERHDPRVLAPALLRTYGLPAAAVSATAALGAWTLFAG